MRGESRTGGARSALAVALLALLVHAGSARAQGAYGFVTGQYQRYEQSLRVTNPDGTSRMVTRAREFWIQTYDLNHQAFLRPNLQLVSNLRYTDLAYVKLPDASRTAAGSLRLNHSVFSLYGTHSPASATIGVSPGGLSQPGDTARILSFTAKTQDTQLGAAVFVPSLPRVDLSWARRHRAADLMSPDETAVNRNAHAAYELGPVSFFGSLGDQRREPKGSDPVVATQRVASAGASLNMAPTPNSNLGLAYDIGDTRNRRGGLTTNTSRTQGGNLSGTWRPSLITDLSASYVVRHSSSVTSRRFNSTDQDGSLYFNVAPTRGVRLTAGAGARTVNSGNGQDLLRYATAVASGEGNVRPGWYGVASASHTTNWDPVRGAFWAEMVRGSSRMKLARGLEAEGYVQVAASGDTASRDQRWNTDASGRLNADPLRSLRLGYATRIYRVGPRLGSATAHSRSQTVDVRWQPVRTLEMVGSYSQNETFSRENPRTSMRTASARWSPLPQWQFSGNWTRSEESRTDVVANQLSGREIMGARVAGALSRRLTLNGGASVADHGAPSESRQYDASLTMSFGR